MVAVTKVLNKQSGVEQAILIHSLLYANYAVGTHLLRMDCAMVLSVATSMTVLNANSTESNKFENKFIFKITQKYWTNLIPCPLKSGWMEQFCILKVQLLSLEMLLATRDASHDFSLIK